MPVTSFRVAFPDDSGTWTAVTYQSRRTVILQDWKTVEVTQSPVRRWDSNPMRRFDLQIYIRPSRHRAAPPRPSRVTIVTMAGGVEDDPITVDIAPRLLMREARLSLPAAGFSWTESKQLLPVAKTWIANGDNRGMCLTLDFVHGPIG